MEYMYVCVCVIKRRCFFDISNNFQKIKSTNFISNHAKNRHTTDFLIDFSSFIIKEELRK